MYALMVDIAADKQRPVYKPMPSREMSGAGTSTSPNRGRNPWRYCWDWGND